MIDEFGEEEWLGRVLADLGGIVGVEGLRRGIVGTGAARAREEKAGQKHSASVRIFIRVVPSSISAEPLVESAVYVPVSLSPSPGIDGCVCSDIPVRFYAVGRNE